MEAKKKSFDNKVFVCDAGSPIPLIEVTRKLAHLYGLKLWSDLAVKYTAQSDEFVLMSPQKISSSTSTYSPGIKVAKENTGVTREELKSVFKDFVLADINKLAPQDWKARTRELIELCRPDIFFSKS